ncbi:hypothetical protein AAVH_19221 [Aphelenchoides avenae]|nr:hypothetical protein AAVH_19221 [Aphelenchus avenae]
MVRFALSHLLLCASVFAIPTAHAACPAGTIQGQPLTGATYCLSVDATTGQWYSDSCGYAKPSLCRVPPLAGKVTTTTSGPSTTNCPAGWTYIAETKKCYQVSHS